MYNRTQKLQTPAFSFFIFFSLIIGMCCLASPSQASTLTEKVLDILRSNPEVIIESVQAYQQEQFELQQKEREKLLKEIQKSPVEFIGDSPSTSEAYTKTLFVEFADFQCPFCKQLHGTLNDFLGKHKNEVNLVFKHLPLSSIHPESLPAAKASWAAKQQDKFWEYHDYLFALSDELGEEKYLKIAQELGLDLDKFNQDRLSQSATEAIESDLKIAEVLGINSTPFLIANGTPMEGAVDLAELEAILSKSGLK